MRGVVDQCSCAHCKPALYNQCNRPLLTLPGGALGAVYVDVAITTVAKWTALFVQGFGHDGGFSGNVTVSVYHLVDAECNSILHARGHLELNHHSITGNKARGESAPRLHVAVIEPTQKFQAVGTPNEQFAAFGHSKFRKREAHGQCSWCLNLCSPHRGAIDVEPLAVCQADVHREFLAKPPRCTFDRVCYSICRPDLLQINGGHAVHRPCRV